MKMGCIFLEQLNPLIAVNLTIFNNYTVVDPCTVYKQIEYVKLVWQVRNVVKINALFGNEFVVEGCIVPVLTDKASILPINIWEVFKDVRKYLELIEQSKHQV